MKICTSRDINIISFIVAIIIVVLVNIYVNKAKEVFTAYRNYKTIEERYVK